MFAMCAILGLCPDWQDWGPDGVKNAQTAMDKAEEYLGVPKVWNHLIVFYFAVPLTFLFDLS